MSRSVDRVHATLAGRIVEPVATGELVMDRDFMEALVRWRGEDADPTALSDIQLTVTASRLLGHDLVCLQSDPPGRRQRDPLARAEAIAPVLAAGYFAAWIVGGPFQQTMASRDFMAFMCAVAGDPDALAADFESATANSAALIEVGVRHGAHGIILADDIAYSKNTYMAPDFGRRFLLPWWKQLVSVAHALKVPILFHSDGNINGFLPLIVEAGFDGLQCIEPAAGMDIFAIAKTYADRLTLMGNIDPAYLSLPSTAGGPHVGDDALERSVTALLGTFAPTGGLILGTSSGLHGGLAPERVYRMAELAGSV